MFCPNCGARLGEGEIKCPLCAQPLTPRDPKAAGLYPRTPRPRIKEDFRGLIFVLTLLLAAAGGMVLAWDLVYPPMTFAPYVLFGLGSFYAAFLLPRWWRRPNPVIFLPVFFAVSAGLWWYLDLDLGWGLFFPLILPLWGGIMLALETVVTLVRYVHGGKFFIYGGLFLVLAALSFVFEVLWHAASEESLRISFSLLPMILFGTLGLCLLVVGIVPPFRRYLERRFFV